MVGDREKILASGFNGYIAKPIEAEVLLSQINAFLAAPPRRPAPVVVSQPVNQPVQGAGPKKEALVLFVDNTQTNIDLVPPQSLSSKGPRDFGRYRQSGRPFGATWFSPANGSQ